MTSGRDVRRAALAAVAVFLAFPAHADDELRAAQATRSELALPLAASPDEEAPDAGVQPSAPETRPGESAWDGGMEPPLFSPSGASPTAQPNGFKLGAALLHAFLSVPAAYDSAAAYPNSYSLVGDLVLRPVLGVELNVETPGVLVDLNGRAGYVLYTGLVDRASSWLSHPEYEVGLQSTFNRAGAVGVQLGGGSSRSDITTNLAAAVPLLSFFNTLHVAVPIHLGAGTIEVAPRFQVDYESFTPFGRLFGPAPLPSMDYFSVRPSLSARWKFQPDFAAVADATFDFRDYLSVLGVGADLLKASAGVAGLLSTHVSARVLVGYARDLARQQAASTVIGQAVGAAWVVGYFFSGKSVLKIRAEYFRLDLPVCGRILAIGSPMFLQQIASAVMNTLINNQLRTYGGPMAIQKEVTHDDLADRRWAAGPFRIAVMDVLRRVSRRMDAERKARDEEE